jgi:uncharacterized protein YuzE
LISVIFVSDPEADAGTLKLGTGPSVETESATDNINLDFDANGRLVSIEILNVSRTAPGLSDRSADLVAAE